MTSGAGVALTAGLWGWAGANWGSGDVNVNVRVVVADLRHVNRAGDRINLRQADLAARINHSGVDRKVRPINHLRPGGHLHVCADRSNLAVSNDDGAALDDRPGDGDDARVAYRVRSAAGLRRRIRPRAAERRRADR